MTPLSPKQRAATLYREIDALGGTGTGDWHEGYSKALNDVLSILIRRGFSEAADADANLRLIAEVVAEADSEEAIGSLDVDIPDGHYPRQWLRAAARAELNRVAQS